MAYRIAGIDVHKKMLAVVVADVEVDDEYRFERLKVGTTPAQLRTLADWLVEREVEEVVMESTAQYWRPVWEALEQYWRSQRRSLEGASPMSGTLHLAQAQSNRGAGGRKKDFPDAERLVKRLVAQELTLSFVPDAEQRLWRTVMRRKYQITRNRVQLHNRLESLLEEAHVKLSSLVTDLLGTSGRRMLQALADGETDPGTVAALADPRLRATAAQLSEACGACATKHRHTSAFDTRHGGKVRSATEVRMRLRQIWLAATGVTALVGVSLAFIGSGSLSAQFGVWNTLAFWTIQSNLLVGIASVLLAFRMNSRSVVLRVAYLTSLTAITLTFLVAHTVLETPVSRGGLFRHDVAPVMAVVGWLVLGPRNIFEWRFIPIPLLCGILYDGVTLIRGAMIDWYPYVFLDPRPLGYAKVFTTIVAFSAQYVLITAILVGVDRWSQRRKQIVMPAGV